MTHQKEIVTKESNKLGISIIENDNGTLSLINYDNDVNLIVSQVRTYIGIINCLAYKKNEAVRRGVSIDEQIISENIDVLTIYMKDLIYTPIEDDEKKENFSGISLYAMETDR
jgi:hypothetical protein